MIIFMLCLFSWVADDADHGDDDDDDDDDDDLTSISNTTYSKNNEHIVLSQLQCRFF